MGAGSGYLSRNHSSNKSEIGYPEMKEDKAKMGSDEKQSRTSSPGENDAVN